MATKIIGQGTAAPIPQQQEAARALSLEQLHQILQTIAGRADIARQVLWHAGRDQASLGAAAEAAATIMTSIGAIADGASGADIIGDADCWNYGPSFAGDREEVRHG
ncbi:hypothetical protein APR50_18610 [Variovorax paradoxus]|jgi:hypothetical protein|uniref:hypothetical protein n=1 Tax=Variovorax paradoxus TaxID=34073 RepID=UPI0006E5870C|nr:hypothetical protein APR49_26030 [Variovorax paradoxus]KPV05634.1 hypothetical protein APR50_18610 [Variovorax paradoxus]KPV17373.1 hypothetical protein APR48_42045 [Variovorax paradoxus]KPV17630.1 hypothetical protein APR47_42375 [Variovorax paradoxus]